MYTPKNNQTLCRILYINKKKFDSAIVKSARGLNKYFLRKDIYRVNEYMKRFL